MDEVETSEAVCIYDLFHNVRTLRGDAASMRVLHAMHHAPDGGCSASCAAACAESDVRAMYPTPQYAEWTREDATQDGQQLADEYAVEMETGSLLPTGVRQLLWDLNLLEGIPDELINAYVQEIMLRADQVCRTAAARRGPSNSNT